MEKAKKNLKRVRNRGYLLGLASLLLAVVFAMPVSAAGKSKVINLKAGQTCHITSKAKSGSKAAGSIGRVEITMQSSKAKYDLTYLQPNKNKEKTKFHFEPKIQNNYYYKKIKGNRKMAITCTSGKVRVEIKNYKGQVSIKKNSKLPYEKKVIKKGKSAVVKPDIYYIDANVGSKYLIQYQVGKEGIVIVDRLNYQAANCKITTYVTLENFKAGKKYQENNYSYDIVKGKSRGLGVVFGPGNTKISSEKGTVTLYKIKQ